MPPLDRRRVPPDVAHRLAALTSAPRRPVAPDHPAWHLLPGAVASGPARDDGTPGGWTPRPDGAPDEAPVDDGAEEPSPERWRPDVRAALAAASPGSPPAAPRVRWVPGWRAAGAAVLVLGLVAGGIVLRAVAAPRGEPVRLPTPAVAGTSAVPQDGVPGAGQGAASPDGAGDEVVVHVVGAVVRPGVVRLARGARVGEAVDAVGGSAPGADLAGVNLARVLTDGEQLVVPVVGAVPLATGGTTAADTAADGLVDLNTADAATLEGLPGVGPVLAERIVQHRTEHPFTTVDDLDDVTGIGPALLADLRARVRV
ncbi:helix-hairpin-helix domain-containing protein [Cellulomonas sp. KH9]|uniref:helix-hairpin-helix domain-containing protein n=1 Tax=Cellulomonas sp. KH9 TaxID=1855324 RepID=UPI0008E5F04D|nr:helix-hairpin-helix domain-containing protein [Cellulomonas sp. KH9]SFK05203.1 competence protein ComEA [Cellulomonas sp. KH9]